MKFGNSIPPVAILATLMVACATGYDGNTNEPDPVSDSQTGALTDFEGNEYSTVRIGDQ